MMRALLFLMALSVPAAQAQVTLGRLFSSPEERAAMEKGRGSSAALLPNSQGEQPAPGMPGGPAMPGQPDPAAMANAPGAGAASDVPGAAGPAPALAPAPTNSLTMSGVLRSSSNRTTVWLNDQPQPGLQNRLSGGADAPKLSVTLPSGKKIQLKPGQRYDLNEGRIKDINEP